MDGLTVLFVVGSFFSGVMFGAFITIVALIAVAVKAERKQKVAVASFLEELQKAQQEAVSTRGHRGPIG